MTHHPVLCDNTAAAVIITNTARDLLLIERREPPYGLAPPTTHVLDYAVGRAIPFPVLCPRAAAEHAHRLTGLRLDPLGMPILAHALDDLCGRALQPGRFPGHFWQVYAATATGELSPCPTRTRGAAWYPRGQLDVVANRTIAVLRGELSAAEFAAMPGLDPVWVWLLHRLGHLPHLDQSGAAGALLAARRGGPVR